MTSLAGAAAVPLGGQQPHRERQAGGDVPGGQHVVDRPGAVAGDRREAGGGVDGVVDGGAAVGVPGQAEHDQVVAARAQPLVGQPAGGREVGQEQAGVRARCGNQRGDQLAALGAAQVDGDRPLALVHAPPEQAGAVRGDRPPVVIDPAAHVVETDHVRPELGQSHPAQRGRDKGGPLDDPEPLQHSGHQGSPAPGTVTVTRSTLADPTERERSASPRVAAVVDNIYTPALGLRRRSYGGTRRPPRPRCAPGAGTAPAISAASSTACSTWRAGCAT